MTKLEIMKEIEKADNELMDWSNNNPKVDPKKVKKLKKVELMSLLGSIRTIKTLLEKCQVKGEKEQDDNNKV